MLGPHLLYKLYRLAASACVCMCACVFVFVLCLLLLWPGPVLAVPVGLHVPACLLQHFPLEITGLCSPLSLGSLYYLPSVMLAATFHHICPQAVSRVPQIFASYTLKGHPVSPL